MGVAVKPPKEDGVGVAVLRRYTTKYREQLQLADTFEIFLQSLDQ